MKTVVLYETAPDTTMEKMMEVFPAHQANEEIFVKAGKILELVRLQFREKERWRFLLIENLPKNL